MDRCIHFLIKSLSFVSICINKKNYTLNYCMHMPKIKLNTFYSILTLYVYNYRHHNYKI